MPIRLLVVDDSSFMIALIRKCLAGASDIDVIGSAATGREAIDRALALKPDCITMDVNMPDIDGVTAVREIMTTMPVPIIMLSAYAEGDAQNTITALAYGAVDFIQKPNGEVSSNLELIRDELIAKIRLASKVKVNRYNNGEVVAPGALAPRPACRPVDRVVAIGVSTGGPRLLKQLMPLFPPNLNAAVLISQHMPGSYIPSLVGQLAAVTPHLQVVEAVDLMEIQSGTVYLSPGDLNLTVKNRKIILRKPGNKDIYIPSADALLVSAAEEYGRNCIGVILTGMGNDGERGVCAVRAAGGHVIAQNRETSTVFGMPLAAIGTGSVNDILPADNIPARIVALISKLNGKSGKDG